MTTGLATPSSTQQLEQLIDRQLIGDLLARYCQRLDEYDIEAIGAVFSDDAVMDQGPGRGGPVVGRQTILDGMKIRQALFRRTHHQLGQCVVDLHGDTASALTYVIAWHQTWAGEVQTARLRYLDQLVRGATGDWRIAHRQSQSLGVEGFGEAQWNWVDRQRPGGQPIP
ncbi:nuclear transport factor 2 family protein [Polaromonas sp.]|uniref:nuclear transport factor 2 family protein n=1 Tax=Polaromonas sp. TaxID=1869339 RepID=UPI001DC59569|nr:nuclear transport factor 2 family protein [Polaromonas sp.]MBT9476174.1 nuclear transport factor 2 family protein [Polaromonas sp.]